MKYDSEKMRKHKRRYGFSLIETVTSVIILALISSSVFVVISRNVDAAADSRQKMRAFEVARDKMEQLLTLNKIEEQIRQEQRRVRESGLNAGVSVFRTAYPGTEVRIGGQSLTLTDPLHKGRIILDREKRIVKAEPFGTPVCPGQS
jgi:type II secretory pathway pseudopilin PulG